MIKGKVGRTSKHGIHVEVEHEHSIDLKTSLHTVKLTARLGAHHHSMTITLGAVDGPRGKVPDAELIRAQLDKHRQEVADEVSWKHLVGEQLADVFQSKPEAYVPPGKKVLALPAKKKTLALRGEQEPFDKTEMKGD